MTEIDSPYSPDDTDLNLFEGMDEIIDYIGLSQEELDQIKTGIQIITIKQLLDLGWNRAEIQDALTIVLCCHGDAERIGVFGSMSRGLVGRDGTPRNIPGTHARSDSDIDIMVEILPSSDAHNFLITDTSGEFSGRVINTFYAYRKSAEEVLFRYQESNALWLYQNQDAITDIQDREDAALYEYMYGV